MCATNGFITYNCIRTELTGITSGDVIYSIGRIPIEKVEDFNNALQKLESNKNTTIGVARNGIKRILSLKLTK